MPQTSSDVAVCPNVWSDSALQENFVELALKEPQARKILAWGLRQSKIVIRIGLARSAGLRGFRYFDKVAGVDIIDVAVNWDIF